jgi:hypothetical protein
MWRGLCLSLLLVSAAVPFGHALAARDESLAAFDARCVPSGCVAPRSNTPGILGRRALPAGRLARLGATPDFRHGLPAAERNASPDTCPVLQRFLAIDDPTPTEFRALRHLDARNEHFDTNAWMDVWTEADGAGGFRYRVAAEGGSDYIRSHVFRATLDAERAMWASGEPDRAGLTPVNYVFEDRGAQADGLAALGVKPRRKDLLLVDGSIFLRPEDGDLVRVEGELSKAPSFWTRHVAIVRRFQRFAGVRMPVALETVANVRIAGRSTFQMTYEYETVNGQRVGSARLRAVPRAARP